MRPLIVLQLLTAALAVHFDPTFCGLGKTCVVKPSGCLSAPSTCLHGMSFRPVSDIMVEVELFFNTNLTDSVWVGYAFSDSCNGPCMGGTKVTECSKLTGQPFSAKFSYNDYTPTNTRIPNAQDLATNILTQDTFSIDGSQVYCKFQQVVVGVSRLLHGKPNADKIFSADKTKKYMVLTAGGPTTDKELRGHFSATYTSAIFDIFGAPAPATVQPITGAPEDICLTCNMLINMALHHYKNGKPSQDQLKETLLQECQDLGVREGDQVRAQCRQLVTTYMNQIYQDLEQQNMTPYNTCKNLGACI